jgi:hypothetical protein
MNYTRAIFLINDNVRCALCTYVTEEDEKFPKQEQFKTFDHGLKEGDYVVVPTDTRHKMTVVKVVGFLPNLDVDLKSDADMDWIIGKVDRADFASIKSQEEQAVQAIKSAQKKKERDELRAAMLADTAALKTLAITGYGDTPVIAPQTE